MSDDLKDWVKRILRALDEHPELKEILYLWLAQDALKDMRSLLKNINPEMEEDKATLCKVRERAYAIERLLLMVVDPVWERSGLPPIERSEDQDYKVSPGNCNA